jgi:O-antigen/teichoic acid export membrane protein
MSEGPVREPPDVLDSHDAGALFVRGGGIRAVAYAGAVAASVAAIPLVTRHLHTIGYGRYVTVTSLLLIVAALTEGGVATLGVREFSSRAGRERRVLMSRLLGLRMFLSTVGAIGAIVFATLAGYPRTLIAGTAIGGVGLVLTNLQVTLAVPLVAGLRLPSLAVLDFLGPAVTAAGLITLAGIGAPLLPFFAVAVLGYGATLAATAMLVRGEVSLRPSFAPRHWRPLIAESIVFAAATALGVVYFQIVVVAMSLLTNAAQVGLFSLAFRVLSVINGIPLLLTGSAFPILLRAARDDQARLHSAVRRLFEGNLLLGGWLALLVVTAAPFAVRVLGGAGYAGSASVLRILGPGVVATFLAAVSSFALLALRRYRELVAINAAMVALAITLCAVLIPAYGARGAAAVTVSLEVVLAIAYTATLIHHHPPLHPDLRRCSRIAVAVLGAFAVALIAPLASLPAAAAGSGTLLVVAAALRVVPPEVVEAAKLLSRRGERR